MKIIHVSDLHLLSPLTERLSADKARTRRMELTDSFRRIINIAEREGADAVIIAGDLFDSERVTRRDAEAILDAMARTSGITFFYLPGNHERGALMRSGADIPQNVKIFGENWTYYELKGVAFVGRSELPKGAFDTLKLDPCRKNIVVLHGSLAEHTVGEETVGRRDLSEKPIDYLALGHYHRYSAERISKRCVAVYSGTPEGRGFDETGECGYVRVTLTDAGACHEFVPSAKRRLHIKEVDITGVLREYEIEDRIASAIDGIPNEDLVRAVLVGEREIGLRRDTEALTERLAGGRFFFEVRDETRLAIRAEEYKNDISLKGEFIRRVLADKTLTERDEIIELGIRALMGERL